MWVMILFKIFPTLVLIVSSASLSARLQPLAINAMFYLVMLILRVWKKYDSEPKAIYD